MIIIVNLVLEIGLKVLKILPILYLFLIVFHV